uniref:Uncharacterized protein n=1 Tax=Plectus sambesii TaxID=2011161 RepID=A0A914WJS5_9BILA
MNDSRTGTRVINRRSEEAPPFFAVVAHRLFSLAPLHVRSKRAARRVQNTTAEENSGGGAVGTDRLIGSAVEGVSDANRSAPTAQSSSTSSDITRCRRVGRTFLIVVEPCDLLTSSSRADGLSRSLTAAADSAHMCTDEMK